MSKGQTRWVRLPVDCFDEEWICDETNDVKIAFVSLLFYAEMVTTRGGTFRRLADTVMARKIGVTSDTYESLIAASKKAQSRLTFADDAITIHDWDTFHPTSAKRQAAYRERQDAVLPFDCDKSDVTSSQEKTEEEKTEEEKGKGASRPVKSLEFFNLLPETHRTPEMLDALEGNFKMRTERKMGGLGEKATRDRVAEFSTFTPQEVIEALKTATKCQWKGVFPRSSAQGAQGKTRSIEDRKNQLRRQREERGAA